MIFASFEFLFLFLPIFLGTYFLTPTRHRNLTLLGFSWLFYAWWRIDFLVLLIAVTAFTFYVARAMGAVGPNSRRGQALLVVGLIGNLGVLGYFKYANFATATFNELITDASFAPVPWTEIVLPIGLSFYVLQSVSYLVDISRGVVPISRSFLDYAAYKAIFAQLIAGPIVRYAEIADELKQRHYSWPQFGSGARSFMIGFAMKTVLADTVSPLADAAFALPHPTLVDSWTGAIGYSLQLYFDFAGYSLMAIGLARMVGFHFPTNFNNPYLSVSIQDFWQRWHITLSRFLRDYLYIPLGGNRCGIARTYANQMLVMTICGLWHGSSWNFVCWGIWHGLLLAGHRCYARLPWARAAATRQQYSGNGARALSFVWRNAATMLGVVIGWVGFRAHDLAAAGTMYAGMVGLNGTAMSDELAWQATPDRIWMVAIAVAVIYLPLIRNLLVAARLSAWPRSWARVRQALATIGPLAGFVLGIILLFSRAAVPFLYFQF
jgi:alginate O-acetyltransferase complex protein AlgI